MKKLIIILLLFITGAANAQCPCPPKDEALFKSDSILVAPRPVTDTIHELILVSTSKRGLVHTEMALAVRKDGQCVKHFDCRGRELKYPVVVWNCEGERKGGKQ